MLQRVSSKTRPRLADVVGDLAAPHPAGARNSPGRPRVLVPHAGVGTQLVVDVQLGVPGGDACFGRAAFSWVQQFNAGVIYGSGP